MPTAQKQQIVTEASTRLAEGAGFYLVSFSGLKVPELEQLRAKVIEAGGELQVIKNRLLKLAIGPELSKALSQHLTGPTMLAYCDRGFVGPAKALMAFANEHPGLSVKGGVVEGRALSSAEVQRIAQLPPREQILAEALGAIASPLSGLVGVLSGAVSQLVYVLEAAIEKQQTGEAA